MKKPVISYRLEQKSNNPNLRTKDELIIAFVSGNFVEVIDNVKKYNRVKVTLKCSIQPKNFGLLRNNFKFDKDVFDNYSKSNKGVKTVMQTFEKKVDELYSNYLLNDIQPTAKQFKEDLIIQLKRKKREVVQTVTILTYLNAKIDYFKNIVGTGRKDELSENSIKPYTTLAHYIQRFETYNNIKLTFQNLDENKYWEFWDFQDKVLKGEIKLEVVEGKKKGTVNKNGFMISSIRKYQKTLFRILKMAQNENVEVVLNTNNSYLILEDKPNAKDIYISEVELQKIYKHNASNEGLHLAKDYVLLSSLTGMRYESMEIAHKEQINSFKDLNYDFEYIHSFQNKTQTEVFIPLLKPVKEILQKYSNQFPKFPQNAVMNKAIKQLFKEANIKATTTTTSHYYKNGVVKETKEVSDVITLHDCRKAFVTNLLLSNTNESIVMSVTHPNSKPTHAMATIYNRANLLDKAKQFVDEVNRVNKVKQSKLYTF